MSDLVWLFLACAVATYATRIGGHLLLSRFVSVNHRVEAALDAVPYAVLTALVAPYFVSKGAAEAFALIVAGLIALRLPVSYTIIIGMAVVAGIRMLLA